MKTFIGIILGISVCLGLAYYEPAHAQAINPAGVRTCTNEGAGVGVCDTTSSTKTNLPFKTLVQGSGITLTDNGASGITIASGSNYPSITFNGSTSGTTVLQPSAVASGTLTLPAATDTLVGKSTVDTLSNKTFIAPNIGAATATSINFGSTALSTYTEGTWTPTVTFGGASVGVTYSTQAGTYSIIGDKVIAIGRIALTSKGSSTGVAMIGGFPVASGSASSNVSSCSISLGNMASTSNNPYCLMPNNSSAANINEYATGNNTSYTDTFFTNTSVVTISVVYKK